jgi:hypothetical protein
MTIFQLSRISNKEREAFLEAGGVPTYPPSFWVLLTAGILSAWFIHAVITQPPSQATIDRHAADKAAFMAEVECGQALQGGAKNPGTFELDRSASRATGSGHTAEVWFSVANAFNVRTEYSGVCRVVGGKVQGFNVAKR